MCSIYKYIRDLNIVHLFRFWPKHNGLENVIRVLLSWMVDKNSYVRSTVHHSSNAVHESCFGVVCALVTCEKVLFRCRWMQNIQNTQTFQHRCIVRNMIFVTYFANVLLLRREPDMECAQLRDTSTIRIHGDRKRRIIRAVGYEVDTIGNLG